MNLHLILYSLALSFPLFANCPKPPANTMPVVKTGDLSLGIEPVEYDTEGYLRILQEQTEILGACLPKYLYQWTSTSNIQRIKRTLDRGWSGLEQTSSPVYLFRSSLGSYAYNSATYRIKLRSGLNYVYFPLAPLIGDLRNCSELSEFYDLRKTVFVTDKPTNNYHEYFICSYNVASEVQIYGREHLQTILSDYQRSVASSPDHIDMLIKSVNGRRINWDRGVQFDGYTWSRATLKQRVDQVSRDFRSRAEKIYRR